MKGAIDKALEYSVKEGFFIPQQFEYLANADKHYETTAVDIFRVLGDLDYFVAGVGTGGTISGVSKKLKEKSPNVKAVAVEPANSPVLSRGKAASHKIQGIGAGFIPGNYNEKYVDEIITVKDEEAIEMAKRFANEEGVLVGISSGAAIFAAIKIAKKIGKGKKVLAISPDGGEKYISMGIYD